MSNQLDDRYKSGDYLDKNPTFHVERAEFKAGNVVAMLQKHKIPASRICDLGCGAGEVLRLMSEMLPNAQELHGYELSPQGIEMCRQREGGNVRYFQQNLLETSEKYSVGISMDVFEHVEDPFAFLRGFLKHADHFVFHIPLDMNAQMVLRGTPIMHVRRKLGHLHYFNKDTAIALLKETGYTIIDSQYTPSAIYRTSRLSARIAAIPRMVCKAILGDFGVRMTGGYSLLVLAGR